MKEWVQLDASHPAMPIFVSFFTDGFYLREAFELTRTLQCFDLDYVIKEVDSKGGWTQNTNIKPSFLLEMDGQFPERSICWIDADARIRKYPIMLNSDKYDLPPISYHWWQGEVGRHGALSGTVLLTATKHRTMILKAWSEMVARNPDLTDQVCMDKAVKLLGVERGDLPAEYCWIYDLALGNVPLHPNNRDVVIEQMQASRWTRKLRV